MFMYVPILLSRSFLHSPSYPVFSSSCLPAVIVIGCTPCFDAGFDRFVCGRIHSARIRKSTGRKMEICLQTLRLALGAQKWNEKKKKSCVPPLADIYTGTVLTLITHTADGKTCSRRKKSFQISDLQLNKNLLLSCRIFSAGWASKFLFPTLNLE